MFIALSLLLVVAIIGSIMADRTHARLARKTLPAPPLVDQCRYCGEPAPYDKYFPMCEDCRAAELEYLTGNHHNI